MKISIITITYNSEKTLEETIKSILYQDYAEMEYILVDGMSVDGTLKIVDKHKNEKMKFISEKDNGISDAFNKGIALASGDIIGIINSDDMLLPGALKKVAKEFEENEDMDILFGNCIRFTNLVTDGYEVVPSNNLEKMKYSFLLLHPSIFVKKSAYNKYGVFDCNFRNAMDYELISKMYFKGAKFKYIDEALSAFRVGGISQTKFGLTMEEHRKIAKRNGGNFVLIQIYILKLYIRRYILAFLNMIKLESFFRKIFKHQRFVANNK